MMWALLFALSLGFASDLPSPGAPPVDSVASSLPVQVTASVVLKVGRADAAIEALRVEAERLGGWMASRDDQSIHCRVPVEKTEAFLAFVARQGLVADRSSSRSELGSELANLEAQVKARREMLARYEALLASASADAVVLVERSAVSLVEQIEEAEGRIRFLRDRAAFSEVHVQFQFRNRAAPNQLAPSSFVWLNSVNLDDLLWGMTARRAPWKSPGVTVPTPAGFSAWKAKGRWRAASPDGVLARARVVRHKPKAELTFWKEALVERLGAQGLKVVAQKDLTGGFVVEAVAPVGELDYTWQVAVFDDGARLVVFEAAGEMVRFEGRRAALAAALEGLGY